MSLSSLYGNSLRVVHCQALTLPRVRLKSVTGDVNSHSILKLGGRNFLSRIFFVQDQPGCTRTSLSNTARFISSPLFYTPRPRARIKRVSSKEFSSYCLPLNQSSNKSHKEMSSHDHTHVKESDKTSHDHHHSHEGGGIFSHSHSHDLHQPNELLSTSKESFKSNPAVRITWIGLLVNVSMVITKGIGGIYFHSQSLIADAIHSVSDMVADFLTLATVNVAAKVGHSTHFPLGYGKIETVGSFLVSGVLIFAGVSVGWSSLLQIFEFALPHYIYEYASMIQIGHSHSHGGFSEAIGDQTHSHSHSQAPIDQPETYREVPNINAAWLAGGSIIVKELLYHKTMQIGLENNSKVLVANAWHHRVDSLTAFVALLTVTGGVLFNVAWLDSIGGLCVSLLIIRAGWGTFKSSWYELIDRGEAKDSEFYEKIKSIVDKEIEVIAKGNFKLDDLSVMSSGANTNIYIHLGTPHGENYNLPDLNKIESSLAHAIKKDDKFVRNIFILFKEQQQKQLDD